MKVIVIVKGKLRSESRLDCSAFLIYFPFFVVVFLQILRHLLYTPTKKLIVEAFHMLINMLKHYSQNIYITSSIFITQ
jgi:hypothetical protein